MADIGDVIPKIQRVRLLGKKLRIGKCARAQSRLKLLIVAALIIIIVVSISTVLLILFYPIETTDISGIGAGFYSGAEVAEWLEDPKSAAMEGWFMFPEDTAEDVLWCCDIEYFETKTDFKYQPRSDWVALVYINKLGQVVPWFGDPNNDYQAPSSQGNPDTVHIIELGTTLRPNSWHKIRVEGDFSTRKFVSFSVYEPSSGLNVTLDLRNYDLWKNPILASFEDGRLLGYYVGAFKAPLFLEGSNIVYCDDIIGEIQLPNGEWFTLLDDGFEEQSEIIPLETMKDKEWKYRWAWEEGKWYQERFTAVVGITSRNSRTESHSCYLDASPFKKTLISDLLG